MLNHNIHNSTVTPRIIKSDTASRNTDLFVGTAATTKRKTISEAALAFEYRTCGNCTEQAAAKHYFSIN